MEKKKISYDTVVRTVALLMALTNQVLAIFGKNKLPFTEDEAYQIISMGLTIYTSVVAWWNNNSFTQEALQADEFMHKIKGK